MLKEIFGLTQHLEGEELRQHKVMESLPFGMILAIVGGYLDSYTYIGHGAVFCNAQTGNLVLLAIGLANGKFLESIVYLPPILAFVLGVVVTEAIKDKGSRILNAEWHYIVLCFEILILIGLGFVPGHGIDLVVTMVASFAASLQVSSFTKLADSGYATTMCTGNLRTASLAAYAAFSRKDKAAAHKSIRFFIIIFTFIVGAAIGCLLTEALGNHSIWLAALLLVLAILFLRLADRSRQPC